MLSVRSPTKSRGTFASTRSPTSDYCQVMATVSFEGETHDEIVGKVRAWLDSVEAGDTDMAAMINQQAAITKDALRIIAVSTWLNL